MGLGSGIFLFFIKKISWQYNASFDYEFLKEASLNAS
jgi:hypothetical protein